jgi:hypothetical protein
MTSLRIAASSIGAMKGARARSLVNMDIQGGENKISVCHLGFWMREMGIENKWVESDGLQE